MTREIVSPVSIGDSPQQRKRAEQRTQKNSSRRFNRTRKKILLLRFISKLGGTVHLCGSALLKPAANQEDQINRQCEDKEEMNDQTERRNGIIRQNLPLSGQMQRRQKNRSKSDTQRRANPIKKPRAQIEVPGGFLRRQQIAEQVCDKYDAEEFQISGIERGTPRRGESPQKKIRNHADRLLRIPQLFRRRRTENLHDTSAQESVNSHQQNDPDFSPCAQAASPIVIPSPRNAGKIPMGSRIVPILPELQIQ